MATFKKVYTEGTVPTRWYNVYSARVYVNATISNSGDARRRWYSPSATYGLGYYNWTSYMSATGGRTYWLDQYNPVYTVPTDCRLISYKFSGNPTSTQTYRFQLKKGTPTYGSAGDTSLTIIGTAQAGTHTAGTYNELGETGLTINLSEGDILIPELCRTSNLDTSLLSFYEATLSMGFEKEI